jgi:sucrose phosphorylase
MVAPDVVIITETNVPHDENIRYFGNGFDEAQMVYNFSLPPLLAHTFLTFDTEHLCRWASQLATPSSETAFLNFTASHDGIGIRPLEGILSEAQIQDLIRHARRCGGDVSSKRNADGSSSPYELNITYLDMMAQEGQGGTRMHARRFLASQAIALSLPGVPAVYVHSLLGSRNWNDGVLQTGRLRTINRQPLDIDQLQRELDDSSSFRSMVFRGYSALLRMRRHQPAFHPNAVFEVLELGSGLFGVRRSCDAQTIYALTSVSEHGQTVSLTGYVPQDALTDLLTGRACPADAIELAPYQTVWLDLPSNQR